MKTKPIIITILIVIAFGLFLYKLPDLSFVSLGVQNQLEEKINKKRENLTKNFKDGDYISVRDLSDGFPVLWNRKIKSRGKLDLSLSRKSTYKVLTDLGCAQGYNSEVRLMFNESIDSGPFAAPVEIEGTVDRQGFVRVESIKSITGFVADDCKEMEIKNNVQ
ncbi:hypothetical protein [Bdellovibrio sp. NC01]|uniref:hypothetical protein n=1 Tax=Bdellovibrio sp. NC01 TaxID=2220073 RepID=UPI001158DEB1|nr:hypothetical protein [Bdellovibrio sp. NC01]QDK37932.1 hypothetical protein DOE51_10215 [Bdellovibrio sp. NC01]